MATIHELQKYIKLLEARIDKLECFLEPMMLERERTLEIEKENRNKGICRVRNITLYSINQKASLHITFKSVGGGTYYMEVKLRQQEYFPWKDVPLCLFETKARVIIHNEGECAKVVELNNITIPSGIKNNSIHLGIKVNVDESQITFFEME